MAEPFDFRVRSAAEFQERYGETEAYSTELFASREEWLEGRKGTLGASSAFKVLDTEQRKRLFEQMTGDAEPEDLSGVELVARGTWGEPHIRAMIPIENPDWEVFDGTNLLFRSKRFEWASASLDCVAVNRKTGEFVDIELKECPWSAKWKGPYAPDGYFAQVCHQSAVTQWAHCVLHPRIYFRSDTGFTTATERYYEYDMTSPECASQVAALMEEERKFMEEVKARRYTPRLSLPSVF